MSRMRQITFPVSMLLGLLPAIWAWQGVQADFSRYQVILDRQPFGEAPEVETLAPAPARPAGPSYADALRLVAMTSSQGDIRVGLVDANVRPPRTYFLFVGEQEAGIRVVSADYEAETVLVEKEGDQRTLRMGGGGGGGPAPGPGMIAGGAQPSEATARQPQRSARVGRMTEGRRQRLEEERRRAEMVPELTGAVLERHLQEYNLQAIREGMPPLPIPLTPEQDAQLVQEGVLPPIE